MKDDLSKSKVYSYGVCGLRVKTNSILCVQCGMWIYSTCAGFKRMTTNFYRNFACWKCEINIGETVEQKS